MRIAATWLVMAAGCLLMATPVRASEPATAEKLAPYDAKRAAEAAKITDPEAATRAYLESVPAERRERTKAYARGQYVLTLVDFAFTAILLAAILGTSLSARLRDFAERRTRSRFLHTVIYAVVFLAGTWLVAFPLTFYRSYVRAKEYDQIHQSFPDWLVDQAKGLAILLVLGSLLIAVLYAVLRRMPRTWWLWAWVVLTAFAVVSIVLVPIFFEPLFFKMTPLDDPKVRDSVLELARSQNVPAHDVLVEDASRVTNNIGAHVTGMLGTSRIVFADTTLQRCHLDEILFITGHEMGHSVLKHIWKSMAVVAGALFLVCLFVRWSFTRLAARWARAGIRSVADPAGLPLFFLLILVVSFVTFPLGNTWSRTIEAQADDFGLDASRLPDAAARDFLMLGEYRDLDPSSSSCSSITPPAATASTTPCCGSRPTTTTANPLQKMKDGAAPESPVNPHQEWSMENMSVARARQVEAIGRQVRLHGWVRTRRDSKGGFSFLELNDGSSFGNVQVIADAKLPNYESEIKKLPVGSSVTVAGEVRKSPAQGQPTEVQAESIKVHGWADPETYPLQKKRHSFEFLRTLAHLRPRTNTFGAIARVRNSVCRSIHDFFQEQGFLYVHAPIITASDCEGAGQMFRVSSLDLGKLPLKEGQVDFAQDFFGRPTYLTVSGQLEAEVFACSVGKVYTFGPTFRAENSNTSRHLAEFWMVEPEMAFYELEDNMDLAEAFIKRIIKDVLERCSEDMAFFNERIEPGVSAALESVLNSEFVRLPYTEAIKVLEKSGNQFEFPVAWGHDLQAEHERYLTEQTFKKPVILHDYPRTIKPFYMRVNDDGKTVRAMDVLVPRVGEIIGGSQREERLDVLEERMKEQKLNPESYWWYLDLRRYGTVPHSGFGLGLERTVQFVTGMANIRDVIPFPRTPGSADF